VSSGHINDTQPTASTPSTPSIPNWAHKCPSTSTETHQHPPGPICAHPLPSLAHLCPPTLLHTCRHHYVPIDTVTHLSMPLHAYRHPYMPTDTHTHLYLTLPLVFPPESSGLLESHSSPGKVRHSSCSPGGIWWDYCVPTLVRSFPLDSRWNPVGILCSNSFLSVM
jgi:hypothetical protein